MGRFIVGDGAGALVVMLILVVRLGGGGFKIVRFGIDAGLVLNHE